MTGPRNQQSLPDGVCSVKEMTERESDVTSSANDKSNSCHSTINRGGDNKGYKGLVRKRIGCWRRPKDMFSAEEQENMEKDTTVQHEVFSETRQSAEQQFRSVYRQPRRRLIFSSPRITSPDEHLFPTDHSLYKEPKQRWRQISDQAGCHRQGGTVMNIGRRPSTAKAFRAGMVGCAAVRVRSLNLWLDYERDTLPDWLDMISEVFVNLEHITLSEDVFPNERDTTVSARMRRLYVLSILPNLKSIDDMAITSEEKKLANPNGHQEDGKAKAPSIEPSIGTECDHQDNSTNVSVPVAISASVSSKDNEIEVEILTNEFRETKHKETEMIVRGADSEIEVVPDDDHNDVDSRSVTDFKYHRIGVKILTDKFGDLKHTETDKTASSTPTTNSEITLRGSDSDEDFFGDEERLTGDEDSSIIDSLSEKTEDFPDNNDFSRANMKKRTQPEQLKSMEYINTSIENGMHSSKNRSNLGPKIQTKRRGRVRALHNDMNNSIELISVPTNDAGSIAGSAASSALFSYYSSDKTLAQRIRLPFSSRKAHILSAFKSNSAAERVSTKLRNEEKHESTRLQACTPVQRQSVTMVPTPQVGCCHILKCDPYPNTKFSFPTGGGRRCSDDISRNKKSSEMYLSTNKRLPPSKSLSSPFPMQFLERHKPTATIGTIELVVKTSESADSDCGGQASSKYDAKGHCQMETISSPSSRMASRKSSPKGANMKLKTKTKRDLPPTCPTGGCKDHANTYHIAKQRKNRACHRRRVADTSKESARSISVMDLDDDDEYE